MKCSACQKDVPDGAKYCPWCGKETSRDESNASWIAGMQEEIREFKSNQYIWSIIFLFMTITAAFGFTFGWGISGSLLVLIISISATILALASIPFVIYYSNKKERAIKALKEGKNQNLTPQK